MGASKIEGKDAEIPARTRTLVRALILVLVAVLVGFHPVWRYGLPRSSEAWSHLQNLEKIPTAMDALRINSMLELFEYRQHYAKYPLFYFVAKLSDIDSPEKAAAYSAVVFSLLPLLFFVLVRFELDEFEAFAAGLILATTTAFVYTMNFFSGGEPLGLAVMLLGLTIHLRKRPIAALPFYLLVVFLHPLTAIFLWLLLVILSLFPRQDQRNDAESALVISVYASVLLAWFLFHVSLGLPLGGFITASMNMGLMIALMVLGTAGSVGVLLFGDRLLRAMRWASLAAEFLSRRIGVLLVAVEALLLVLFLVAGVPGTEQGLQPGVILFYLPLLLAIPMIGLRHKELGRLSVAFFTSFVTMLAAGLLVLPQGLPVYRLAPYGAVALAILLAPVVRVPKARYAFAAIVAGMAATSYPDAAHYFGFDEQYYPSELSAFAILQNTTASGCIFTDVRMEDFVTYIERTSTLVPDDGPVNLSPRDVGLVTRHMREIGLYPPGSEWYREPFEIDLAELDARGTRLYDNSHVQVYLSTERLELAGVAD